MMAPRREPSFPHETQKPGRQCLNLGGPPQPLRVGFEGMLCVLHVCICCVCVCLYVLRRVRFLHTKLLCVWNGSRFSSLPEASQGGMPVCVCIHREESGLSKSSSGQAYSAAYPL